MMLLRFKNKISLVILFALASFFLVHSFDAQASRPIDFSAFILNKQNKKISSGEYDVSFAIYTTDRKNQTDSLGQPIWQETQKITIKDGVISSYLGLVNPLPTSLNFSEGDFYLGVKMGTDSEMVPRKMIGSVPASSDASSLQGHVVSTQEGGIPVLGKGGKLEATAMPVITSVGKINTGTWEGSAVADKYIDSSSNWNDAYAKQVNTWAAPLSFLAGEASLKYNTTNLVVNAGLLDTAQNISITATPTFAGVNVTGDVDITGSFKVNGTPIAGGPGTTYDAGGTLLQLVGSTFSIKEGALAQNKFCSYDATNGIVCNTDSSSIGHTATTISATANGLSIDGSQVLTLGLASSGVTGALSGTDWTTFSGKQAALNGTGFVKMSGTTVSYDNSTYLSTVDISSNTNLAKSGTLLQLTGDTLSIKEGTLTDTRICTFSNTNGIVCDTSSASVGHTAATINATANGLSVDGSQVLTLGLASSGVTGALSGTDWTTFSGKQAALNGTGFVKMSGTTVSYDNSTYITSADDTVSGTELDGTFSTNGLLRRTAAGTYSTMGLGTLNDTRICTYSTTNGIVCDTTAGSVGTTYAAGGTLLQLVGSTFSIKEGTLTNNKFCIYDSTNGIVCNTDSSSIGHSPATINATANGLSVDGSQVLTLGLASSGVTGALSGSDWTTFSGKQAALNGTGFVKVSGTTVTYDNSSYVTGTPWTGMGYVTTSDDTVSGTELDGTFSTNGILRRTGAGTYSTLSVGTLSNNKFCSYDATNGIVCNTDSSSIGHTAATINATANGLSVDGSQVLTLGLASSGVTGAISGSDWTTFNGKQAALNGTGLVKMTGTTVSYDNSTYITSADDTVSGTELDGTFSTNGLLRRTAAGTYSTMGLGTLTDTRICTYSITNGIVCDTTSASVGHTAATINATANGLSVDGAQVLTLGLASSGVTGALSGTDWTTFNGKQAAGSYITASSTDTLTNKSGNISQWTNNSNFITDGNTNWDNSYGFVTTSDDSVSGTELDGTFSTNGLLRRTAAGTYSTLGVGTLTDSKVCTYSTANGIVCNTDNGGMAIGGAVTNGALAGSVYFGGVSGALNQDNGNFFWDDTNNYLGIGTTTPSAMLNVFGTTNAIRLSYNAGNYASLNSASNGDLQFTTSSATEASVLIGDGATSQDNSLIFDGVGSADFYTGFDATDSNFKIGSGQSVGTTPWLTITSAGNVGFGVTAPTYKFQVDWNNDGTNSAYVNNSNAWTNGSADYAEYFYTKDIDLKAGEALCIDNANANAVKRCQRSGDSDLIGIVSTSPSVLGNAPEGRENDKNYIITAMLGQVPGFVSNENGEIKIGDSLTAAITPGYLRKANAGESTVGVAMQDLKDSNGNIQILISRRNQSLTVEKVEQAVTDNIAAMNIQDQVNKLVSDAGTNLNTQIATQQASFTDLQTQVTAFSNKLNIELKNQISELQSRMSIAEALNSGNKDEIDTLKLLLGVDRVANAEDISILGKFSSETTETGALVIRVADEEARTIGQAIICPANFEVDADNDCTVAQEDTDKDGKDDNTKNPISDGKRIVVKTKSVNEKSKVFLTPKTIIETPLTVAKTITGKSFEVEMKNATTEKVIFDWLIVEEKN